MNAFRLDKKIQTKSNLHISVGTILKETFQCKTPCTLTSVWSWSFFEGGSKLVGLMTKHQYSILNIVSMYSKVIIVFFDTEKYQFRIISDTHMYLHFFVNFIFPKNDANRTDAIVHTYLLSNNISKK